MGCYERRSEAFYIAENDAMIIQFNLLSKSLVIANKMSDLSNHTIISDKVLDAIMSTRKIINNHDIKKVIARLLYPNYYFDILDEFINNKVDEQKLKNIISKQTKYEQLIKEISKYDQNILLPDWIKKDK